MRSKKLTIIIGFRNREPERVRRCLQSLANQTIDDFTVIFVDYGSQPPLTRYIQSVVESYPLCQYVYTHTAGWSWNRSRALNIGFQLAETEYVLFSDVDIIFSPNFVETVYKAQTGDAVIGCAPHFLPEELTDYRNLDKYIRVLPHGRSAHVGVCLCAPSSAIRELQGFDERFEYWGLEDSDIHRRALSLGLRECWIHEKTAIFHQWHPIRRGGVLSSFQGSFQERWLDPYYNRSKLKLVCNPSGWGMITEIKQRPLIKVLPEIETGTALTYPLLLKRLENSKHTKDRRQCLFLTDRKINPRLVQVVANYQRAAISGVGKYCLWLGEYRLERRVANAIEQHLMRIPTAAKDVGLVVLDLATHLRISKPLLERLVGLLSTGGFLVVSNLDVQNASTERGYFSKLHVFFIQNLCRILRILGVKYHHHLTQVLKSLQMPSNLRESLYLARMDVTEIADYTLDFEADGVKAIFMNGELR